jgi:site-specific recombinase XerD
MAKPKFQLRKPQAETETLISLVYRFGNNKFVYSTGESINPKYWDAKLQRAQNNIRGNKPLAASLKSINFQLERYISKLAEILSSLKIQKITPTIEGLKIEFDKEFKKNTAAKKTDLFGFIDNHIKTVRFTRTTPPKPINERTLKKYRTTLKVLQDFADKKRKGRLNFKDIDLGFYYDFIEFLQKDYGHTTNTIGKYIQILKIFLREATEAGINKNLAFENRKFAAMSEAVEHIYLTESELTQLWELDLTNNKRLEAVRDLFLVGCYTALRFSDFTNIHPENIVNNAIKIKTQKTNQLVYVPLHWRVEAILKKYDNHLPRAISNQKMNNYLKELGKLAGIDTPFEVNKTKAGLRFSATHPKYELISTHTARRSAATNMFKAGVSSIAIMKLTGHKTETVFLKYINITEEENAQMLMNHDYFTKGRLRAI